jgi:hypothetical protein
MFDGSPEAKYSYDLKDLTKMIYELQSLLKLHTDLRRQFEVSPSQSYIQCCAEYSFIIVSGELRRALTQMMERVRSLDMGLYLSPEEQNRLKELSSFMTTVLSGEKFDALSRSLTLNEDTWDENPEFY